MASNALLSFIRTAKEKGVTDDAIVIILRQRGWSDRKIYDALAACYEESLGIPAPARGGRAESAREAFFYLLSFAMLGVWVVALVWLGDLLIDRAFPSALDTAYTFSRSSVAWQMASIIIAFPIYLWIGYLLSREVKQRPETLDSGVRKWLTYIALVVTAATLVGDAVWFLTAFLNGGLTDRFIAKAFMLFIIVGAVYWYYLATIRSDRPATSYNRIFGSAAAVGVVLAIVLGFAGIGSPSHQAALNDDNRRTQDLYFLAMGVHQSYDSTKRLPPGLAAIQNPGTHRNDPQGKPYVYQPGTGSSYQLCATFSADTLADQSDAWRHGAGFRCYNLNAALSPQWPGSS